MSKYTVTLRSICEQFSGLDESVGYNNVNEVITNSASKIFNFDYPVFNEEHRHELEYKILKHYYMREICCETVGYWLLLLERKMQEIMPYFNQRYESETIEFDPMGDTHLTRESTVDSTASGITNGSNSTLDKRRHSDTPQGSIENLEDGSYLTYADYNDSVNNTTGSTNTNGNEHSISTVKGKTGSSTNYSDLLIKYRKTFLNIDKEIIDELADLFMQVW